MWAILLFQKIGTNSLNHADSEETVAQFKTVVQFPGNSVFKFQGFRLYMAHTIGHIL